VTAGIPLLDVSLTAHVEMSYIGGNGLKLGMSGCSLGYKDFFHLVCALLFCESLVVSGTMLLVLCHFAGVKEAS
jgi:hypothetical protein